MNPPAPPESALALVEMSDVAVAPASAPEAPLVEGVRWRVNAGDYWVIGGLHNSGKSVLLAAAAGIHRPVRGSIRLFGRDIADLPEEELLRELLRIGLVFESEGRLFSQLTVAENVALPPRYHNNWSAAEAGETVSAVLELTGLSPHAQSLPGRLNRIWQRRVGLARALTLHPEVLLLDNPLAGLDPRQARWWLDFLGRLAAGHEFLERRPVTLVVTADDFRPWLEHGRQFAMLDQQRLTILGGRDELREPTEPLLRELLAL